MIRIPLSVDGDKTEKNSVFKNTQIHMDGAWMWVEKRLWTLVFGERMETDKDDKDWISWKQKSNSAINSAEVS